MEEGEERRRHPASGRRYWSPDLAAAANSVPATAVVATASGDGANGPRAPDLAGFSVEAKGGEVEGEMAGGTGASGGDGDGVDRSAA